MVVTLVLIINRAAKQANTKVFLNITYIISQDFTMLWGGVVWIVGIWDTDEYKEL